MMMRILLAFLALASWTSTLPAPAGALADVFNAGNIFAALNTLQTEVAAVIGRCGLTAGHGIGHCVPSRRS